MRKLLVLLGLLLGLTANLGADAETLQARWHDGAVHLQWRGKGRLLQRSTSPWNPLWLTGAQTCGYPVKEIAVHGQDNYIDGSVAAGANYTYALSWEGAAAPASCGVRFNARPGRRLATFMPLALKT